MPIRPCRSNSARRSPRSRRQRRRSRQPQQHAGQAQQQQRYAEQADQHPPGEADEQALVQVQQEVQRRRRWQHPAAGRVEVQPAVQARIADAEGGMAGSGQQQGRIADVDAFLARPFEQALQRKGSSRLRRGPQPLAQVVVAKTPGATEQHHEQQHAEQRAGATVQREQERTRRHFNRAPPAATTPGPVPAGYRPGARRSCRTTRQQPADKQQQAHPERAEEPGVETLERVVQGQPASQQIAAGGRRRQAAGERQRNPPGPAEARLARHQNAPRRLTLKLRGSP